MLLTPTPAATPTATSPPAYRMPPAMVAAIAFAFLVPLVFYFATARSIVAIWNSSETFAHGYIILPISLWLIWRRRANFAALPARSWWPAIALLAAAGFGWLLARMGEVQVVMQYAFVAMIPIIALAILGRRLSSSLTFPLLFLLLAVPFGDIFIAPLISFTADFTVWALQATGIPVLRNGTRFDIPSGSWSVVEACSGVRYLISSITLGCLYAYLTYRSARRRAAFMVAAVIVPIAANGLRAYMIVMIGHLSGMTLAVGVDHLIYGWLFFGLVMFAMFWIGSLWREDPETRVANDAAAAPTIASSPAIFNVRDSTAATVRMALAIAFVCAIWPLYAQFSDRVTFNPAPVRLGKVDIGWPAAPAFSGWVPRFAPADAQFSGVFQPAAAVASQPVGVNILYYRNQRNGKALISSGNRLADYEDEAHELNATGHTETVGARTLALRESTLQTAAGKLLVWKWYWIGNTFTASDYAGKALQARDKLLLRSDDGAAILLSAPFGTDAEEARKSLRAFLGTGLPAIERTLSSARGR